jgi:tetratricopeptide (TPR) repeat protein
VIEEALMRHRLEKYPDDFSAYLNLGALLLSRLDAQAAAPMLEQAVRIDPARPEAHDMLGSAMENLGRRAEAIKEFRASLKVQSDYISARYDLAIALAKTGQLDEAIDEFQKVIGAFPKSARLHTQFGEMLARAGKLPGALSQFDEALSLEPSDETARKDREFVARQLEQSK